MIEELENIKLIRELNFLKSDFEYKTNLVQIYNIDFLNSVEKILDLNTELKKIYETKKNLRIESVNKVVEFEEKIEEESDEDLISENTKLKGFYRQIVKLTHPDKVNNSSLNFLYNEASLAFKEGKTADMILLCDRLGLSYEINSEDKDLLKQEIQDLRNKISLLESSYSYQWANGEDENLKNKIAVNYIKTAIS